MYYILKCEEHLPQQFLTTQQQAEQQARLREKIKENKLRVAAGEFFENVRKQAQVVNVLNDAAKAQQMPGVAATVNGRPVALEQLADECITRHGQRSAGRRDQPQNPPAGAEPQAGGYRAGRDRRRDEPCGRGLRLS